MEDRLMVLKALPRALQRSFHWGHLGRDETLRKSSDLWSSYTGTFCSLSRCARNLRMQVKILNTIRSQCQYGNLPIAENVSDEISMDFVGPFKVVTRTKEKLIVSFDHKSNWPKAKFFRTPTTDNVLEFLHNHMGLFGVPRQIRTDRGRHFAPNDFINFAVIGLLSILRARGSGRP